ncbi:MAG: DUF3108 domain-containing protein [Oligoflexia bacterium]|nr:DUF3108 domain-containing protein [Oligoflexia bacterium]
MLVRLLAIAAVSFAMACSVWAEDGDTTESDSTVSAQTEHITTPVFHVDFSRFHPNLGTYDYVVSWQGIPAADVSISVNQEGMRYRVVATARTYSGIDLFYKLRYRAEGLLSAVDLLPIKTIIDQQENSTKKNIQIEFLDNGDIRSVRSKNGSGASVNVLSTDNFTLEPFSAAFIARSLDWKVGQTNVFDAYNGKTRYLISLTADHEETMRVNGEERKVWVIVPRVTLAENNTPHTKLRDARIYVTADERRDILKIVSSVFVGSVTTALDAFTPAVQPGLTHMAERERIILK